MDSKERHELKDNDLAEFLENFGDFWSRHGNGIMVAVTIFLVAWIGIRYYNNTWARGQENAWADLSATTTPQGYRERAKESAGIPAVPQLALLRGAEAYHRQAIQLEQETGGKEDTGVMSAEESLDAAEAMYRQVLDSDADPVFRANAAVGLANAAETRQDFKAAGEYWAKAKKIAEQARLATIAAQAKVRMGLLDELTRPIVFAEPKAEDQTEAEPGSAPGTSDTKTETGESKDPSDQTTQAVQALTPAEAEVPAAPADPGQ